MMIGEMFDFFGFLLKNANKYTCSDSRVSLPCVNNKCHRCNYVSIQMHEVNNQNIVNTSLTFGTSLTFPKQFQ